MTLGKGAWIIIAILVILVAWGLIGANEAKDVGISCDMGIGDNLCWTWHTNVVGQIQEGLNDAFGNNG